MFHQLNLHGDALDTELLSRMVAKEEFLRCAAHIPIKKLRKIAKVSGFLIF